MSAVQHLRAATAADHDRVDAAFGGFDLADRDDYGRFLTAHAMALPAVERVLSQVPDLPSPRPRADLLRSDLAALGLDEPAPLSPPPCPGLAAGYGAAYVIEGSRLGGGLLARRVSADLPRAYLSAVHRSGEWRAFLGLLDRAAADDDAWIAEGVASARAVFSLYAEAAVRAVRITLPAAR